MAVKNVKDCQGPNKWNKLGGAFCQKIFGHEKMFEIFNILKFSPKKHQKVRGDPRVAG